MCGSSSVDISQPGGNSVVSGWPGNMLPSPLGLFNRSLESTVCAPGAVGSRYR